MAVVYAGNVEERRGSRVSLALHGTDWEHRDTRETREAQPSGEALEYFYYKHYDKLAYRV